MPLRTFGLGLALGVAAVSSSHAQASAPSIEEFFKGHLSGDGYFDDHHNGERRTIRMDIHGVDRGKDFVVTEDLAFSDGEKRHNVWTFTKIGDGHYVGRRSDVIGTADVEQQGNGLRMTYKAKVQSKGSAYDLNFDETYTLQNARELTNTTRVSLLFVTVGDGAATIRKVGN